MRPHGGAGLSQRGGLCRPDRAGVLRPGLWGKKLRDELYRRGVPRDYWDDALAQVEDSTEAIDAFLQKKLAGWTGDRKQLQKVTAALARRGFSWSDIRDALARYETGIDIEYD